MRKIAIVGADGSGKTVLMAVLGTRFELPDETGRMLSAKDQATFTAVKQAMGLIRNGLWPEATKKGTTSVLRWDLCHMQNNRLQRDAELEVLDCANELYQLACETHSEAETASYREEIKLLRNHLTAADTVFLLINLKEIINGNETNPRTLEMLWVTKGILDFLAESKCIERVTLVFTQVSSYRETLAACGGEISAYMKYLPHLYPHYPELPVLAVSSVNEVIVGDDACEVPAPNFTSTGLDDLLEAIDVAAHNMKEEKNLDEDEEEEDKIEDEIEDEVEDDDNNEEDNEEEDEEEKAVNNEDDVEAFERYYIVARQGDANAQYELGDCYLEGRGVKQNEVLAFKWFHQAANQGQVDAQNMLGRCYVEGWGVEADETKAIECYRKATDQGLAAALYNLGVCYYDGLGVKKDETLAFKWFCKAAKQGYAEAQNRLGLCYLNGRGVEKDESLAFKWFRKAAKQGDADAQNMLGRCYEEGWGVEVDETKAVEWYREAADQGLAVAQSNLGNCYLYGRGVEENKTTATYWLELAADQGYENAKATLREQRESTRMTWRTNIGSIGIVIIIDALSSHLLRNCFLSLCPNKSLALAFYSCMLGACVYITIENVYRVLRWIFRKE